MVTGVRFYAMARWRYIASWGTRRARWGTVQRHVPGSLQEVIPSKTKREWKEKRHQASHMIRGTNSRGPSLRGSRDVLET